MAVGQTPGARCLPWKIDFPCSLLCSFRIDRVGYGHEPQPCGDGLFNCSQGLVHMLQCSSTFQVPPLAAGSLRCHQPPSLSPWVLVPEIHCGPGDAQLGSPRAHAGPQGAWVLDVRLVTAYSPDM